MITFASRLFKPNQSLTLNTEYKSSPPVEKRWNQFYWLLVGWLVLLIVLFYAFTKYFE